MLCFQFLCVLNAVMPEEFRCTGAGFREQTEHMTPTLQAGCIYNNYTHNVKFPHNALSLFRREAIPWAKLYKAAVMRFVELAYLSHVKH